MKQSIDTFTSDLFSASRGRPKKTTSLTAAQRQAKRRALLRESGFGSLTVILPIDLLDGLDDFVRFKCLSKDSVIEKLLRSQLLRKR